MFVKDLNPRAGNFGKVDINSKIEQNVIRVWIQIETDAVIASDLASILGKLDRVKVIECKEFPGWYDWASDTYVRPCSTVDLTISI